MRTRRDVLLATALLLIAAGALSFGSGLTESFTTDEPVHLTAGASYLATGDFRLNPEHPPLAKMWAALGLGLSPHTPFTKDLDGWSKGLVTSVDLDWLQRKNDGNALLRGPRAFMVLVLLGLVAAIGWTAWRLLGPEAGLLATAIAAFEPLLLAHGHYVTTDVPLALFALLTLLGLSRFLERPSWPRFFVLSACLSVTSLVKYSWVLVVPACLVMTVAAFLRHRVRPVATRFPWAALVILPAAVALAIWACYGFRFDPFRPDDSPLPEKDAWRAVLLPGAPVPFSPVTRDEAWDDVFRGRSGDPRTGPSVALARLARRARLLPDAYLYGFTYATRHSENRKAYLHGRFSDSGWRSYFLVAYLIKTPLAELLLLAAGLVALLTRRCRIVGDPVLALGLGTFAVVYGATAVATNLNIGLRHILPMYPALIVTASASAAWARHRAGRIGVFLAAAWLGATALFAFPFYLGYFNEAVGGWRNGHRWLVDSNLDWDQDHLRLRDYQRAHPNERIVFLALGESPTPPGLTFDLFVPRRPGQPWPPPPAAATYVISASWLVGTFNLMTRDESWEPPAARQRYAALWTRYGRQPPPARDDASPEWRTYLLFDTSRRALLVRRLRSRPPDERIGTSLFLFRLTDADLDALTRPD